MAVKIKKSVLKQKSSEAAPLVDEGAHMESFRQARNARRTELVEDYVELIADLIDHNGEARKVDIASRLGVAHPTVIKMIKRLEEGNLVTQRPYRGVFLTEEGRRLAERCRARHNIVEAFLVAVGVSPETARLDAEGIEHHVSSETLDVFAAYTRRKNGSAS